jgi:hypothetical protein
MADAQEQAKSAGGAAESGSLLDEIMLQTKMKPSDDGYDAAKKGVQGIRLQRSGKLGRFKPEDLLTFIKETGKHTKVLTIFVGEINR